LMPWIQRPRMFFEEIYSPVLASTHWWLGYRKTPLAVTAFAASTHSSIVESASACNGVWDVHPQHRCHLGFRGGGPGVGVIRPKASRISTRVLGIGPMKAGTTVVLQALGAATQWPIGFDCEELARSTIIWDVLNGHKDVEQIIEACFTSIFSWELGKDVLLTPLATKIKGEWKKISSQEDELRLYFLVRDPLECVRSLIEHLTLRLRFNEHDIGAQYLSLDNMPHASRFTLGKRLYLDVTLDGLNYTGYVDAAAQRWALAIDQYLGCPHAFVLVRYEDFQKSPVPTIRLLLQRLGLESLWDDAAATRVREAVSIRYQSQYTELGVPLWTLSVLTSGGGSIQHCDLGRSSWGTRCQNHQIWSRA